MENNSSAANLIDEIATDIPKIRFALFAPIETSSWARFNSVRMLQVVDSDQANSARKQHSSQRQKAEMQTEKQANSGSIVMYKKTQNVQSIDRSSA